MRSPHIILTSAIVLIGSALITDITATMHPQRTRIGDVATVPNGIVAPPQVTSYTPPLYNLDAFANSIEGTVTVEAAVDTQGNVKVLRILKGLGYGLDQSAMNALGEWKFAPALRNGIPVDSVSQIDVDFTLDNATFGIGDGISPPRVVRRVEPRYPAAARSIRYTGTVKLGAVIQKDGSVNLVRIIQGLEHGLSESAAEALSQWKFRPGTMGDGKPVPVSVDIEVNFNLR